MFLPLLAVLIQAMSEGVTTFLLVPSRDFKHYGSLFKTCSGLYLAVIVSVWLEHSRISNRTSFPEGRLLSWVYTMCWHYVEKHPDPELVFWIPLMTQDLCMLCSLHLWSFNNKNHCLKYLLPVYETSQRLLFSPCDKDGCSFRGKKICLKSPWWYDLVQQPNAHPLSWSVPSPLGWGENRSKARRVMYTVL